MYNFPALKTIPALTDCVFLIKQRFLCVEQPTGTVIMYGEVKIMMILNMSMIQWRSMFGAL
jgi:hypothetical protein